MAATTPEFIKWARGHSDAVRSMYMAARETRHLPDHLRRRRLAGRLADDTSLAVPEGQGYRLFANGSFPEADEGAAEASRLLAISEAVLAERRKARSSKQFLVNLLDAKTLSADHPLVRLALHPRLLAGVTAYMHTVPILRSVQVFYSGAVDREHISSQLYHCDADDTRQLKIFLLCSEVRRANGPLTILDADRSRRVRQAYGYRYKDRLTDQQVEQVVGAHEPFELVGTPGAVCLVDTSRCFHYGSRVEPGAAPRLVAMVQYLSPFAFVLPDGPQAGAALAHLDHPGLNPLQRAVLTGDARLAA